LIYFAPQPFNMQILLDLPSKTISQVKFANVYQLKFASCPFSIEQRQVE